MIMKISERVMFGYCLTVKQIWIQIQLKKKESFLFPYVQTKNYFKTIIKINLFYIYIYIFSTKTHFYLFYICFLLYNTNKKYNLIFISLTIFYPNNPSPIVFDIGF
jgi:hypothetical protein